MKTIKKTIIVPYDSNWPHIFTREASLIKEALQDNCLDIHHIGSTAVPGLIAKPKIDMLIVVKDPKLACKQLENIGMQYRGEYNIPLQYGFSKRGNANLNLHVYEENHPEIELNLLFRDYLRTHSDTRDAYANFKTKLLQDPSSSLKVNSVFTNYTLRKGDFIREVLQKTNFNRLRICKCNDKTEWQAAKHFRDRYFFMPQSIEDPYTWTFNHENHTHLVLYQGGKIIGYAHIQFWPKQRAALRIIAINEAKQNQGYGSKFLALIEKWLKTRGIKTIHVESNPPSFYLKNGYINMPFNDPNGYENLKDELLGKLL